MTMNGFITRMFTAGGGVSSMRWVFVWTYLFATVVPIGSWAIVYVRKDGVADLGSGIVALVTLIVGAITAGKVTQAFGENRGKENGKPAEPAAQP